MITKKKVFFAWQMEQEKAWLEDLAKQGLILKKLSLFTYHFEEVEPQDLVYQFDFQILHKNKEQDYLELFQDWTFGARFGGWYYFYKKKEDNKSNEIYMNNRSKRALFTRLLGFLLIVGFPLYYQILIVFPNMEPSRFEFPQFYFFVRIIVLLFMGLWIYALMRILLVAKRMQANIRE